MLLDFDRGITTKIHKALTGVDVVFMPDTLFERKRIRDKINKESNLPYASVWRDSVRIDRDRWDPLSTFNFVRGHFTNFPDCKEAEIYQIFPIKTTYTLTLWDTEKGGLTEKQLNIFKMFLTDPIVEVTDSETHHLDMRALILHEDNDFSEDYELEREEKVAYFKATTSFELEAWAFNYELTRAILSRVDIMYYNKHGEFLEEQWIPPS